ncbi:hypothetical protein D0T84_04425 [Dysgonomonas sp. 521]|uniref:hypothetical protein n=1 Tax=Dysgonomonas sp. 521 TaxID=2302932 RepID=UPI0013D18299|nr:hypothetical protein [Dysgonomonas sp. 521]NDV94163.1 hypothetical protein [Dysgonomonas sp. 521]
MLQQRKKDYLQRLIDEFFKKLQQVVSGDAQLGDAERQSLLQECFVFFSENFDVSGSENLPMLVEKISDGELLEQYAKALMLRYDISEQKDRGDLYRALEIVEYIQDADKTYSWDRVVLREDLLHRLGE